MKVACERCNEITNTDSRIFKDKWEAIRTEYSKYYLCEGCTSDFYRFLNGAKIKSKELEQDKPEAKNYI